MFTKVVVLFLFSIKIKYKNSNYCLWAIKYNIEVHHFVAIQLFRSYLQTYVIYNSYWHCELYFTYSRFTRENIKPAWSALTNSSAHIAMCNALNSDFTYMHCRAFRLNFDCNATHICSSWAFLLVPPATCRRPTQPWFYRCNSAYNAMCRISAVAREIGRACPLRRTVPLKYPACGSRVARPTAIWIPSFPRISDILNAICWSNSTPPAGPSSYVALCLAVARHRLWNMIWISQNCSHQFYPTAKTPSNLAPPNNRVSPLAVLRRDTHHRKR